MEPKAVAASQDDRLMSEGRESGTRARKREQVNESKEMRADEIGIVPPDRTAIAQENLQAFPIVHSLEFPTRVPPPEAEQTQNRFGSETRVDAT